MNINDIAKPVNAANLNENLEKRFGQRIKLEDFSLEQLQNSRNKVRTALAQVETNESFDKVHTSENYQKNKLFLDILNAEIAERENISEGKKKKYKSDAQRKAIHAQKNEDFEMQVEPEVDSHSEDQMQQRQLSTIEDAADELSDLISHSEELPEWVKKKIVLATSYVDTVRDYMKSAGKIDREMSMESIVREGSAHGYNVVKWHKKHGDQLKLSKWLKKQADLPKDAFVYFDDADLVYGEETIVPDALVNPELKFIDLLNALEKAAGVNPTEYGDGVYRKPETSTESVIREGAEEKAEIVMAARSMVDKITSWMEDTGEMQTESTLEIGDSIRDELGEETSERFTSIVKPALESLYSTLESTRSTLVDGVRLVAGEEVEDMPGDDLDMDDDLEPTVDQEDDLDLDLDEPADLDDEFSAADAAAGADEEAGRERRESVERPVRLARMLSSKKK